MLSWSALILVTATSVKLNLNPITIKPGQIAVGVRADLSDLSGPKSR